MGTRIWLLIYGYTHMVAHIAMVTDKHAFQNETKVKRQYDRSHVIMLSGRS